MTLHAADFSDPRDSAFAEIGSRGELPHLYKPNGTYFVTFRLADAVTRNSRCTLGSAAIAIASSSEPPLQLGSCLLANPENAAVVQDAIRYFDGDRYHLLAWCVMPNHVHVVYVTCKDWLPDSIHHAWKSFTAHKINERLRRRGALWERESFDHLIRSIDDCDRFVRYVEENPVAGNLCERVDQWQFSSARLKG